MPIMLEIVAHDDQPHDTSSVLGQDPYHGAARDNPLWHFQVLKLSINQQQWQLKKAPDLSNCARTKHIEVQYHYAREKVLEGKIKMVPTKTDENLLTSSQKV